MAGKSKVLKLSENIRNFISEKITNGSSIRETHQAVQDMGGDISVSSLARHTRTLAKESAEMRKLMVLAGAILQQIQKENISPEDSVRVLGCLLTARLQKQIVEPDEEFDPKNFGDLCKSLKTLSAVLKENPQAIKNNAEEIDPNIKAILDIMEKESHEHYD